MREPPALRDEALLSALREGYGLAATEVTFLPLGYDAAAAVYQARATEGREYFVKVRGDGVNAAGLAVSRYLHEQGVAEVLAPLATLGGGLWQPLDGYALIVYPFLHDAVPLPGGQADDEWRRLGATLRQLHAVALPPEL